MSEHSEDQTPRERAKRWGEAEAREVLREWRESGLSAAAFARWKGITALRLAYWKQRLSSPASTDRIEFVPVPLAKAESGGQSSSPIEIAYGDVIIRLREVNAEQIARLVVALARRARQC
jgi:hypothetical protein